MSRDCGRNVDQDQPGLREKEDQVINGRAKEGTADQLGLEKNAAGSERETILRGDENATVPQETRGGGKKRLGTLLGLHRAANSGG